MGDGSEDYGVLERILNGTQEPRDLPWEILKNITNDFSEDRIIGFGGFGIVYKGVFQKRSVAVKRIPVNKYTIDDRLFCREVKCLLKTMDHRNVVRFVGFCSNTHNGYTKKIGSEEIVLHEIRERLLCFEYVSNGSLDKHITDELRGLDWNTRFDIIIGICDGLRYLHEKIKIIHMDLKPANIMVDNGMVPKITDFGLARPDAKLHTTGERFISRGYSAPEYENGGMTTRQCDIYSLGVIMIELVTGRNIAPDKNKVLRKWRHRWNKFPSYTTLQAQQVIKCIETAERCMENEPSKRPSLSDIIDNLNAIGPMNNHFSAVDQIPQSPFNDEDHDHMLDIEPLELRFAFEPSKEISTVVVLTNKTGNGIAFNINVVSKLEYCTQPNKGIVQPRSECVVNIILQAQETPLSFPRGRGGEFIIVQSRKVGDDAGITDKNITERTFNNEVGTVVDEVNVKFVYELAREPIVAPVPKDIHPRERGAKRLDFHPVQKLISATNVSCSSNTSHLAVDIMTGTMGTLLPKVRELLKPEHKLETIVKKDVKALERRLMLLHGGLLKLSQAQQDQLDPQDQAWAKIVKEMSYDIEDAVDELSLSLSGSGQITDLNGFGQWIAKKMFYLIIERKTKYYISDVIKEINTQVKEVSDRPDAYKGGNFVAKKSLDPRIFALYKDPKDLVGIDDTKQELLERLKGGDNLKIISVCGGGGLGKTTLAKEVFDRHSAEFVLKAFVPVGRNPNRTDVLKDILFSLNKKTYVSIHNAKWDETKLIDELHFVLENRRYFIVIDDIWDRPTWKLIKSALVDNNRGSRIITTSRSFEVVEGSEICNLEPLSYGQSKKLFYTRLLGHNGTSNVDQLHDEQSAKILRKCGGVPLAIIATATLLAGRPREEWTSVYNSIGFRGDVEDTVKVLEFSYYDLPCHLKTCLLYLTIFREDQEIEKTTLVWKWIAEGFVNEEPGQTLFKVGERYFNELINRSLILPVADTCSIYACRVHDMVLDMIRSLAKKEHFVTLLDGTEANLFSESNARIQALHWHSVQHWDFTPDITCKLESKVRSFNCTLASFNLRYVLPIFKVLRVLSIDRGLLSGYGPDYLDYLKPSRVPHLRYLGLYRTRVCWLPTDIGGFRFLETLDLRGTHIEILPQSIVLLRQLKCLRSEDRTIRLPDGMGKLTSLEELRLEKVVDSPNFVEELGKLTELRVLHIVTYMFRDNLNKTLVESLSNLQKMEELELCDGGRCDEPNWEGFKPSRQLRHLRLHNICQSKGLPAWISPSCLPMLSSLDMAVPSATPQDTVVLGIFKELRFLNLHVRDESPVHADIAAGAFPKLRYCYMGPMQLNYLPGAMPCLESLHLHIAVRKLMDESFVFDFDSLQHLPLLDKVHATINCWHTKTEEAKVAEDALRRAVEGHPQRPVLGLQKVALCADDMQPQQEIS